MQLTPEGQQRIDELARQYHVSVDAVMSMLQAVIDGRGTMAQFNHPEFGGAGQWMQGGMTMVSDMFNHRLKSQVEGLCSELASLLASSSPNVLQPTSFQSQRQGGQSSSPADRATGSVSLFVPEAGRSGHWWPEELGTPSSAGSQNHVRYAYFAQAKRLAIEVNGRVTVYDTQDHQISGFSQQQSGGSSVSFSSQHGLVDVTRLPVVSSSEMGAGASSQTSPTESPGAPLVSSREATSASPSPATQTSTEDVDIFAAIEKLGALKERGLLTEEEFANKKADLLSRL
jgi:hypothetical protein